MRRIAFFAILALFAAKATATEFAFSHFQTGPLSDATIVVRSQRGVYAYASIVRNDSGDADFVAGAASEIDESKTIAQPQRADPAALSLAALRCESSIHVVEENGLFPVF